MNRITRFTTAGLCGAAVLCFGLMNRLNVARAEDRTGGPTATALVVGAGDMKDKIHGKVLFSSTVDGVRIVAEVDGLTPGKHGFHIHQHPDVSSPDMKSAGPHFNPGGHKHGGPDSAEHHAGDLGNLTADDKGHAHMDMVFKDLKMEGPTGVVAHSVIIHEKEDDLKTDPSGDSGARIAGGVIVLDTSKDAEKEPSKK